MAGCGTIGDADYVYHQRHPPADVDFTATASTPRPLPARGLAGADAGGRHLDIGSRYTRRRVLGGPWEEQADVACLPARVRPPAVGVWRDRSQAGRRVRAIFATRTADGR